MERDQGFMTLALEQASQAALHDEVPVGAVLVLGEQVIAQAYNQPIGLCDPSAHAEILALRTAALLVGNYRLPDCELFVTLEPCAMCAMAMIHARLRRVVFAAPDPKTGAAGSALNVFDKQFNHHTKVEGGLLQLPAAALLQSFFSAKRLRK